MFAVVLQTSVIFFFTNFLFTRAHYLLNVGNLAHTDWKTDPDVVYVGRPSLWGNPFSVKAHGRLQAIIKFEAHLTQNESLMSKIDTLRGKKLACYCFPNSCHADILLKYIYK